MRRRLRTRARRALRAALAALVLTAPPAAARAADDEALALPEEPLPLASLPARPRPVLELGEPYLAPSRIGDGFTLPTGAVWQPQLLVWGQLRSALQADFGRAPDRAQWANRLDLFAQLALSGTERVVASIEPFQDGTQFTGYRFGLDGASAGTVNDVDFELQTLYFEGDVGELFPRLDRETLWPLDVGFMVGRVPVLFQDGLLIDDRMDAVGLVQNSILARGTSNLRVSFLAAFDHVTRGGTNQGTPDTRLFGLFTELDRSATTWALDLVGVDAGGDTDGVFAGLSAIRRIEGRLNLTARLLGSEPLGGASPEVGRGLLGVLGLSLAPPGTHDVAYLNLVAAAGRYTPAARAEDRGGPLDRIGILFEAPGLGSIGAPLANDADHVMGGALGYQKFFDGGRLQVVAEVGGRTRYDSARGAMVGAGVRVQRALGRRMILRLDGWLGHRRDTGRFGGARSELLVKF
jgi:hypothetical protein